LRFALAVSLGLHAVALWVPEIDPASAPEAPLHLVAELRPALPEPPPPAPAPVPDAEVQRPEKAPATASRSPPRKKERAIRPAMPTTSTTPATSIITAPPVAGAAASIPARSGPAGADEAAVDAAPPVEAAPPAPAVPTVVAARLPPRGRIRFRVDRGDSGFEIGAAFQEWSFEAERYRLVSTVETTGLAWLLRSVDIAMESIGRISADGLQPEAFGVMRSGKKARERALFDWETMKVRVSQDSDHALDPGAQDMLSFYYQLGFLDISPGQTASMPLATGKKYSVYHLENLGDERIEIPLGVLDTRHLRAPGDNVTEIWLAYEYRLLPVKIRHVDKQGDAFVQVATEIVFGPARE
jgi:hypothetical protein